MKNKIIIGTLALVSALALALGFAAAFGKVIGGDTVGKMYDDLHNAPAAIQDAMPGFIEGHVNFAYIGGIITGVMGFLGLAGAAVLGWAEYKGTLEINTILIAVIGTVVVTMLALSIAAIVCQGQLNSETWMQEKAAAWALENPTQAQGIMTWIRQLTA